MYLRNAQREQIMHGILFGRLYVAFPSFWSVRTKQFAWGVLREVMEPFEFLFISDMFNITLTCAVSRELFTGRKCFQQKFST
jgi:hypothetical protein